MFLAQVRFCILKEWAVNGILFVNDFVTPEGLSFQELYEIVRNSPKQNIRIQGRVFVSFSIFMQGR